MKIIRKTISAILLAGKRGRCGNVSAMPLSII